MSDIPSLTNSSAGAPGTPSGSGWKTAVLFGAVVALAGATAYQFYSMNQIRQELADTRDQLLDQISKVHETSNVSTATNRRAVDDLKAKVDEARRQANQLAGEAKVVAEKEVNALEAKLVKMEEVQTQRVAAVASEVNAVKDETTAAKSRIGEVSTEVTNVKTDLSATKAEQEKIIANLKTARGDLDMQSGLIATNGRELAALRALGERNYTEFKLAKEKTARKVGDIQVRLKAADPKRNRYTIEVIADDKLVEKKDKTINEPVQFLLSRATQPYELVVNDVKKDLISGYVASPKVQKSRNE